MQNKRRLRRIRRALAKKKRFLCLVIVLLSLGGMYRGAIYYLTAHSEKVSALSKEVKHASFEHDPKRYIELSRQQTLAELEPWFVALFALIPTSLTLVAIIFIFSSRGRNTRTKAPEQQWVVAMRDRAIEYRESH